VELPVTFGIEVEFEDGDRAAITADLRRAHLFGWRVKPDSSCGHELITPILGSYEDFDRLATALEILKRHGARITTRCGLHVHYGMQSFSFDQVRRVLGFFARHEETMFSLVDPARRNNRYCKRLENVEDVIKHGSDAWSDEFRHSWINGQAHRRHNTVELRLLEGTLELDAIRGWTFLGMAMVVAAATRPVRVRGSTGLYSLLVSCGGYRLRGKDPETYQIVAKDWALKAYDRWILPNTAVEAVEEEPWWAEPTEQAQTPVREAVMNVRVDWETQPLARTLLDAGSWNVPTTYSATNTATNAAVWTSSYWTELANSASSVIHDSLTIEIDALASAAD
jgi:hypothetical protein